VISCSILRLRVVCLSSRLESAFPMSWSPALTLIKRSRRGIVHTTAPLRALPTYNCFLLCADQINSQLPTFGLWRSHRKLLPVSLPVRLTPALHDVTLLAVTRDRADREARFRTSRAPAAAHLMGEAG
jgi:hypothetical protein